MEPPSSPPMAAKTCCSNHCSQENIISMPKAAASSMQQRHPSSEDQGILWCITIYCPLNLPILWKDLKSPKVGASKGLILRPPVGP